MTAVEIVHAVYVRLENRPGTLQRATKVLGDHRINVDAISGETLGNTGYVRILTHKAQEAVHAMKNAGVEAFVSEMAVVNLPNKPGELARASAELAAAGINVEGIVTTTDGRLAFRTSDVERAAAILRKL